MYISAYVIVICVSAYVLHVVARCKKNINAFLSKTIVNADEAYTLLETCWVCDNILY